MYKSFNDKKRKVGKYGKESCRKKEARKEVYEKKYKENNQKTGPKEKKVTLI